MDKNAEHKWGTHNMGPGHQIMAELTTKVPGMNFHDYEKTGKPGRSFQSAAVAESRKGNGGWFGNYQEAKADGRGAINRYTSSHSQARKAASAQIAKIPFALSQYIAHVHKP